MLINGVILGQVRVLLWKISRLKFFLYSNNLCFSGLCECLELRLPKVLQGLHAKGAVKNIWCEKAVADNNLRIIAGTFDMYMSNGMSRNTDMSDSNSLQRDRPKN